MQVRKKCWSLYLQEDNSWRRSGKSKATLKRCFANCTKTQPILIVFRWMESFQWGISKNVHRNKRWNEFKEFLWKIHWTEVSEKYKNISHTHTHMIYHIRITHIYRMHTHHNHAETHTDHTRIHYTLIHAYIKDVCIWI